SGQFGYHRLLDTTRIRTELGYTDIVSKEKAIRLTAEWWAEHGRSHTASMKALTDRFDYATEDMLVDEYRTATRSVFQHAPEPLVTIHPFRHPKATNGGASSNDAMVIDDGSDEGAGPR